MTGSTYCDESEAVASGSAGVAEIVAALESAMHEACTLPPSLLFGTTPARFTGNRDESGMVEIVVDYQDDWAAQWYRRMRLRMIPGEVRLAKKLRNLWILATPGAIRARRLARRAKRRMLRRLAREFTRPPRGVEA